MNTQFFPKKPASLTKLIETIANDTIGNVERAIKLVNGYEIHNPQFTLGIAKEEGI